MFQDGGGGATLCRLFVLFMGKENSAAKIVSSAILGKDFETVVINGKAYIIKPPTIHKIAGAGYFLSDLDGVGSVMDILRSMKDVGKAASALSFLIKGDESLSDELSKGELGEVVDALSKGYSMISAENFFKLSALAKNVAMLTAKPK